MITVEALAEEILRVDPTGMTEALEFSRKLLPFIERYIVAYGDSRAQAMFDMMLPAKAIATPKPAGAVPLPAIRAYAEIRGTDDPDVFEENLWAWMKGMPVPEGDNITLFCALPDAIRYGDAREAAGRADAVPVPVLEAVLRERGFPAVSDALGYSRNFATANPTLSQTTRDHIEGLCNMLEIAAQHPAPQQMTTQGEAVTDPDGERYRHAVKFMAPGIFRGGAGFGLAMGNDRHTKEEIDATIDAARLTGPQS